MTLNTIPPLAETNPMQAASWVHLAAISAAERLRQPAYRAAEATYRAACVGGYSMQAEAAMYAAFDAADARFRAIVDATEAAWQEIVTAQRASAEPAVA